VVRTLYVGSCFTNVVLLVVRTTNKTILVKHEPTYNVQTTNKTTLVKHELTYNVRTTKSDIYVFMCIWDMYASDIVITSNTRC
jgi:hypothetical protein